MVKHTQHCVMPSLAPIWLWVVLIISADYEEELGLNEEKEWPMGRQP